MSAVIAEPAAEAAPIRRPRKKILVIAAAVLALVLALGAGTVVLLKQRAARAAAAASDDAVAAEPAGGSHADPRSIPIYLPLDPFIVNLADRDADRYAQIGITFELDNNVSGEEIKAYMPAIRNAILMVLANKTAKELLSREGKEMLAQEIQREAARPMGIEVAEPEPVSPFLAEHATSAVAGAVAVASVAPAKAKQPHRNPNAQRNPIRHVHFSSFIIQ